MFSKATICIFRTDRLVTADKPPTNMYADCYAYITTNAHRVITKFSNVDIRCRMTVTICETRQTLSVKSAKKIPSPDYNRIIKLKIKMNSLVTVQIKINTFLSRTDVRQKPEINYQLKLFFLYSIETEIA